MARSDAAQLEELKIARDAITDGIREGRLTIEYDIRGRRHIVSDPVKALENIERTITIYERKSANATRSPFRVGSIQRARRSG